MIHHSLNDLRNNDAVLYLPIYGEKEPYPFDSTRPRSPLRGTRVPPRQPFCLPPAGVCRQGPRL